MNAHRRLAACTALALSAMQTLAIAQSRPDSLAMSCAQVRALVLRDGGVVIGSGPNIYERYVSTPAYCAAGDATQRAFIPTRDNPQCYAGERCVPRQFYLTPGL